MQDVIQFQYNIHSKLHESEKTSVLMAKNLVDQKEQASSVLKQDMTT